MSIAKKSETGKGNSFTANSLAGMAAKMDKWIRMAAADGQAFHEFESEWHEMIHRIDSIRKLSLANDRNVFFQVT